MAGMLRVPRSRGALSGVCLVLLGAWGALIPFIGPYFRYAYSPDTGWTYTTGRLWLEILPGVATLLGGLIVLAASSRPAALFGAWLAAMSGAWYVVGRPLSTLWTAGGVPAAGSPVGGTVARAVEQVGFFAGLGAAIIFFAALALGRFTVLGHREAVRAAEEAAMAEQATADQVTADPAIADRTATDRIAASRMAAGRTEPMAAGRTEPMAAGRTEPMAAGRTEPMAAGRMAAGRVSTGRTAAGQPATERVATPRAGTDPAVTGDAPPR